MHRDPREEPGLVHFYADESVDLEHLCTWNPDDEPQSFSDGIGHNLLELHRRLQLNGYATTCGPIIPNDARLVVIAPQQAAALSARQFLKFNWKIRRFRVVSVRSDFPFDLPRYTRIDVEIAPSRSFVNLYGNRRTRFLPPLPQRGLIPRRDSRGDQISVIGLKANPENVPPELLLPELTAALASTNVTIDIDTPTETGGSDHRWHDFQELDAVICARRDGVEIAAKPATKLLNAWAAGVIPIARREPAYIELATDRVDAVFFDEFDELPKVISEIQSDDALRSTLWRGVKNAAIGQGSVDALVDRWWNLCIENRRAPSALRSVRSMAFTLCYVVPRRALRVAKRKLTSISQSTVSGGRP